MARSKRSDFSLYQRNGIYYARAWDPLAERYTSGKTTGQTRKAAAAVAAQRMLERGDFGRIGPDPPLLDYIRDFWRTTKRKLSTSYRERQIYYVEKVIAEHPGIDRLRLTRVTKGHLNRLSEWLELESDLSGHSAEKALASVTIPLNHAFTMGEIGVEVARKVKKPSAQHNERGVLSLDEIGAIIELDEKDPRKKAMVLLAALAGLRRGEVRALHWQSVDLDAGVLRVESNYTDGDGFKRPKADSFRTVPLVAPLVESLRAVLKASPYTEPEDLVIYSPDRGKPVGITLIGGTFRKTIARIGISEADRARRNLVYHGLRHAFASMSRDSGLSDFAVSRLTGQRSRALLENYSHASVIEMDATRKKLDARFKQSG